MAWTYAELKAADAELGIADPAQAAASLNAQTETKSADVSTADARQVILLSGEWVKIKTFAKQALTGQPQDQAIAAADLCIDTLTLTEVLHVADDTHWATVQQMMAGLQAAGVLSADSASQWSALRNRVIPKWEPPVTDQDVLGARSL